MSVESLRLAWTWIFIVGLGAFAGIALVMIPLGFRDLLQLLKELRESSDDD